MQRDDTSGERTRRIAELNDRLRKDGTGGRVFVTRGVAAQGATFVLEARRAVRSFDTFTADNDPHGEHDFGVLEIGGQKLFWKVDYYDPTMEFGSEDPSDPEKTCRVLTILLADEY